MQINPNLKVKGMLMNLDLKVREMLMNILPYIHFITYNL